jgi:hypothetical protein
LRLPDRTFGNGLSALTRPRVGKTHKRRRAGNRTGQMKLRRGVEVVGQER